MKLEISFDTKNGIKFNANDIRTLISDLEKLANIPPIEPDNDFRLVYGEKEFRIVERDIIVSKDGDINYPLKYELRDYGSGNSDRIRVLVGNRHESSRRLNETTY